MAESHVVRTVLVSVCNRGRRRRCSWRRASRSGGGDHVAGVNLSLLLTVTVHRYLWSTSSSVTFTSTERRIHPDDPTLSPCGGSSHGRHELRVFPDVADTYKYPHNLHSFHYHPTPRISPLCLPTSQSKSPGKSPLSSTRSAPSLSPPSPTTDARADLPVFIQGHDRQWPGRPRRHRSQARLHSCAWRQRAVARTDLHEPASGHGLRHVRPPVLSG
jgi:hypothetical protein